MIKKNKLTLILSSIVILLPMLIGVFGGSFLPDEMAVHWGLDGEADGWMSPTYAFLIIPPIFLAVHWLCVILTNVLDKNAAEQNRKLMKIVLWIIPVISVGVFGMMVMGALGYTSSMLGLVYLLIGIPFIIIGNYMPKTSRNRTMGIKIKWTLANDENWAATHRFAGKVYVIVGFICLLGMALPSVALPIVLISVILICVILPIVYSYRFYKKQIREGRASKEDYEQGYTAMVKNKKLGIIIALVTLAFVGVMMFTGSIEFDVGESALDIDATFSGGVTIKYEDIDSIEYREGAIGGTRSFGFASARLLLGTFTNDEFGSYKRYTYSGSDSCIVLTLDGETVVIGAQNEESTKELYEAISKKISSRGE